jgi:hypothetical protein
VPDEGFLRPEAEILSESSLVPDANQVRPAPTRFTHEVVDATPFFYGAHGDQAAGELPAGTRVVLLREGEDGRCWVVDGRGLYVAIACASLRAVRS